MTGDQGDMLSRLKGVLPTGWFPVTTTGEASQSPILDGVLSGAAWVFAWAYALLQYVIQQSRIATATGVWLDIISQDFFGSGLARRTSEADGIYRTRILNELFREKGTRASVIATLTDITGVAPVVFEPAYTHDTGGWDTGGLAYDTAGAWGETDLPFQFFVTAYRPGSSGIPNSDGWDGSIGGWDVGAIQWTDASMNAGPVPDLAIYSAVANVVPAGTIAWMRIENGDTGSATPPALPPGAEWIGADGAPLLGPDGAQLYLPVAKS
jgi:hypothetical protein